MLNPNAKKLVEALRSGKFKQGRGTLHLGDEYCCLGVACEISGLGEWVPDEESLSEEETRRWSGAQSYKISVLGVTTQESSCLPQEVRDYFGFTNNAGGAVEWLRAPSLHGAVPCLMSLNDCGATFEEIADIIESEPKGLFE